jgi:hypothetical protein
MEVNGKNGDSKMATRVQAVRTLRKLALGEF